MARYDGGWGFGGRGDDLGYPGYDEDYGDRSRAMRGRGADYDEDAHGPFRGITWLGGGRPDVDPYDEGLRGRGSPNQNVHGGLSADNLRGGYDRGMRGYDPGYRAFRPQPRPFHDDGPWNAGARGGYEPDRHEGGWPTRGHAMDRGWSGPPRGYDVGFRGGPMRSGAGYGRYSATDARDEYGADFGPRRGGMDRSYPRPGMDRGAYGYDRSFRGGPRRY